MSDRPKTRNRLLLYLGISTVTSLLAGLTLAMFGDGSLSWAEFRFAWAILALKATADVLITARAFIDRTAGEESDEIKQKELTEAYRAERGEPS